MVKKKQMDNHDEQEVWLITARHPMPRNASQKEQEWPQGTMPALISQNLLHDFNTQLLDS